MIAPIIDRERLLSRIEALGAVGRDSLGRLARLAGTKADKDGRDQLALWLKEAGLSVEVDQIGNMFARLEPPGLADVPPLMLGSHIDTVLNGGVLDGALGVLAGLAVLEALSPARGTLSRPLVVAAFTNEEGARFAPDMMGSLVYAGGLDLETALGAVDRDKTTLRAALEEIGYAGDAPVGRIRPFAFLELHIEQGPVLERAAKAIGVVETLQGISWRRVVLPGAANHAGTTPLDLRRDAGLAAARLTVFVRDQARRLGGGSVATVGTLRLEPDVVNVIPGRATFTVDLRDPDEARLKAAEKGLEAFLLTLADEEGVAVASETLARFEPVIFDGALVDLVERLAADRGLSSMRMTSGAGHDAQMMARICPAAMIFVPSIGGVSHNPREHTAPDDIVQGAQLLLDAVVALAGPAGE